MLVITIKPRERVQIGDDIAIWNREDHNVKIAIWAPGDMPIIRDSAKVKKPTKE